MIVFSNLRKGILSNFQSNHGTSCACLSRILSIIGNPEIQMMYNIMQLCKNEVYNAFLTVSYCLDFFETLYNQ